MTLPNDSSDESVIAVEPQDDICVVRFLVTELRDRPLMEQLQDELRVLAKNFSKFVINFSGVVYLSSQAIGNLIKLRRSILEAGGSIRCCDLEPQIAEVFDVAQLNELFDVFDTKESALAGF